MTNIKQLLVVNLTLAASIIASNAQTTPIIVDHAQEIVFGQSGSFSGHFKYYGISIRDAILAYFEHVNQNGGIQGKKLRLISLDDAGDSEKTKENIELLYHKHGVTMFFGVMGTRGIISLLPLIKEKKIAMYFPWGGDETLRDPSLTNIINGLGLLEPQVQILAQYVSNTLHLKKSHHFSCR